MISSSHQGIHPIRKTKKYSAPLRLWHWANAIVICGSLLTILINATIMEDSNTGKVLKTSFKQSGAVVSDDSVQSAAHALSDGFWFMHVYFGYGLASLLIFRLILEIFQVADKRIINKLKMILSKFNGTKKEREHARNEFFVKILYAAFYLLLITMVATGLFIGYGGSLAIYESIISGVRKVHGFGMYLVLAFITVHLAGVFIAERKRSKGIISEMINGGTEGS